MPKKAVIRCEYSRCNSIAKYRMTEGRGAWLCGTHARTMRKKFGLHIAKTE